MTTNVLPNVKLTQLRAFIAVAEHGSYRHAAQVLFRTQPAVSLAIKQLEQLLGSDLLLKGKHGQLTAFGSYFLPQAKRLYQYYETTIQGALNVAAAQSGSVHLGVLPSIATHYLSDIVRRFSESHPNIALNVQDDNGDNLRNKLLSGQIDIAISSIWQREPELSHIPLCRDAVGIVARTDHPALQALPCQTFNSIANHKLISNGTTPLLSGPLAQAFADSSVQIINMASLEAVLSAGTGLTTLPWLAFPKHNANLRFVQLMEDSDHPRIERCIALMWRKESQLLPAALAIQATVLTSIAHITAALPQEFVYLDENALNGQSLQIRG